MSLQTKNVFLTGGAQGLGKSFVDGLLSAGAKVVFGDINSTQGKITESEFENKYGAENVRFLVVDCTDAAKFEEAFTAAVDFLGHVDLMVNNAGMVHEFQWQQCIQLNYAALVQGTLMAEKHMRKDKGGKGGRIINVSSIVGLTNNPFCPVYTGTKHAVRAFTCCLSMAPDLQHQAVEFGVLCPDAALTDMQEDDSKFRHIQTFPVEARRAIAAPPVRIQEGFMKLATLEEMNGAVLYVSKDEMNFRRMDHVNIGETWPVKEDSSS